jgi:hypothetical protein
MSEVQLIGPLKKKKIASYRIGFEDRLDRFDQFN